MEHDVKGPPASGARLSAIEEEIRATLQRAIPDLPEAALEHGLHRFRELRQEITRPLPIDLQPPPEIGLSAQQAEAVSRAIADNMQRVARLMRERIVYPLVIELIRLELQAQLAELGPQAR